MSIRERNHVIPEMLAKSWTDDAGKFHWFNKLDSRRGIQHVTPRGAFWKKKLYVLETFEPGPDGDVVKKKDDSVEVHLGRNVEGPAEPILAAIIQQVRQDVVPVLDGSARRILERFYFCQYTRTPNSRDSIMTADEAHAMTVELARQFEADRGYPLSEEERRLLRPETMKRIYGNAFASFVGNPDDSGQAILRRAGLIVLSAPPGSLVIGSDPVAEFPSPDGSELGLGDSISVLPIAPDVAVAFGPKRLDGAMTNFRPEAIVETNKRIVAQSDSFAATCEDLVRSLLTD